MTAWLYEKIRIMASTGSEQPKSEEHLDVYITHVKVNRELGQVNFWAQLDPVGAEELEELDILIQQKAEADPYPPEPKSLLVGEPCLANFIEDSRWYRARVEQCTENDVIAYFMDYGNTEIIPFNLIRRADSSVFATLRAQATECILEGVKVVGDKPGTLAYLKKLLADQSFIGKPAGFVAGRVHMTLQMETESQEIVADRIAREGFGLPAKTRISSGDRHAAGGDAKIAFKKMGLDIGSREKLYTSFIESPSSFWIQQSCISRDLDNLMNDLMGFYCEDGSKAETVRRAEEGLLCVALFSEDETFYRATVEKVLANNECRVFFVDYGNSEVTSVNNLRVITPEFLKLPTISINCCLSGIEAASCTSPAATARFEELTGDKELCGKVVGFKGDRCAILLVDPNGRENADIAGVLVKEGLAKRDLEQFPSKGSRRVSEKAGQPSPVAAVATRPSAAPPQQQQQQQRQPVIQSYTVPSVRPGSKHEVQVTSVNSLSNIACQLLKDAEAFDEMMTSLQDTYSSAAGDTRITSPVVNQPCASQFTEDDSWYRAKITAVNGSNVDVTYVDYGNSETLPVSRLRVLKSQFFELSEQCITCSLQGISADDGNTTKAKEHFENMTSEKTYNTSVTDVFGDVHAVVLIDTETSVNVNKEMAKFFQSAKPSSRGQYQQNSQPARAQPKEQQGFGQRTPPRDQQEQGFGQRAQPTVKSPPRHEQPQVNNHQERPGSSPGRPSAPAEAASFTEIQLPSGETPVYLSHGSNPLEIWCQPVKSQPELEKLMEEVYNKYTTKSIPALKNVSVGTPCMAFFAEDEGWYRAVVVNKHVGELEVLFVDYGNTARVKKEKVKQIAPDLMKLPTQAVKCALKNWGDAGSAAPKVIAKMKELAASVDQFKCECRGSSGGAYEIELMWGRNRMSDELKKLQTQAVKERKEKREAAAAAAAAKPPAPQKQATPQAPVASTGLISSALDDIKLNAHEDFIVSHVDNPARFWCQPAKSCEALDELMVKINNHYTGSSGDALETVLAGGFCIAKYSEDDGWYRAQILKTISVSHVEMHFIDYGNSDKVDVSNLRKLRPEFRSLKSQAVLCALDGHMGDDYEQDLITKFEELVLEKQLVGDVKAKKAGMIALNLFDTTDAKDVNINQEIKGMMGTQGGNASIANGYPQSTFSKGFESEIYATHIEGVHQFFVQESSKTEAIETMSNNLQDAYASVGASDLQLSQSNVGQPCCAQFTEDEQWYRAIITEKPTPGRAKVCFVDFGNSEEQDVSKLKSVKPEFLNQESLAVECRLGQCRTSMPEALEKFETLILDKPIRCVFHGIMSAPYGVTLHDGDVDINKEMSGVVGEDSNKMATDDINGSAAAGEAESGSLQMAKPSPWTGKTFPREELNTVSSVQEVKVVQAVSPTKFFVQPLHYLELTGELAKEIDAFTEGVLSILVLPNWQMTAQIGMPCLVQRSSEDSKYCRAEILDVLGSGKAEVSLVDLGVEQTVDVSELRPINAKLVDLPVLRIECKLRGVVPANAAADWDDATCDVFREITIDRTMGIEVGDEGADLYTDDKKSVGLKLIELDLAVDPATVKEQVVVSQEEEAKTEDATSEQSVLYFLSANGPTEFVCQPASSANDLAELMDNLAAHYEEAINQAGVTLEVGQQCVARFTEDDGWYRAMVDAVDGDNVTVRYTDYGNSEVLTKNRMCKIQPQFVELPAQAIAYKVLPELMHPSQWNEDVKSLLEESCAERELTVTLVDNTPTVRLGQEDVTFIQTTLQDSLPPVEQVEQVESGESVSLIFIAADGPTEFVCQPVSSADELAELMDNLAAHYEEAINQAGVTLEVGQQCVARYTEDDGWYRAIIEAVDGDDVTVRYTDYGNSEVLTKNRMCKIQPQFVELPAQAIAYKVLPELMHSSQWNEDVKALLEESCAERELTVTLVDNTPTVRLGQEDVTFIQTTLQDSLPPVEQVEQVELGEAVSLIFLSVDGPTAMMCQPISTANELLELMDNIAAYYEDESNEAAFTPEVDAHCVAQFTEDDGWYRATVKAIDGTDINVLYTDYGNSETLSQDRIRAMQPQFQELAAQAINYKVTPALMHTSQWNDDVKATIDEACAEREINGTLVGSADSHMIRLSQEDLDFIKESVVDVLPPVAEEEETEGINEVVDALVKTAITDALEEMTIPANITSAAGINVLALFDKVTECLLKDELQADDKDVGVDAEGKEGDVKDNVKKMVEEVISKAVEQVCKEEEGEAKDTVPHELLDELIESVANDLHISAATETLEEGDHSEETKVDDGEQEKADSVKEDGSENEKDDDEIGSQDGSEDGTSNELTNEVHPSPQRKRTKSGDELRSKDTNEFELEVHEESFNFEQAAEDKEYCPDSKKPKIKDGAAPNQCVMGCGTDEEEEEDDEEGEKESTVKEEEEEEGDKTTEGDETTAEDKTTEKTEKETAAEKENQTEEDDETNEQDENDEEDDDGIEEDFKDAEEDEVTTTEVTGDDKPEVEDAETKETGEDESETQVDEKEDGKEDSVSSKESKDEAGDQEDSFESAPSSPERDGGDSSPETTKETPISKEGGDVTDDAAPVVNGSAEPVDDSA